MDSALGAERRTRLASLRRVQPILALGAPLIGFYLIQTAVSLAATAMLGRLGTAAIAGVGAGGAVYTAICALLWGVDTGVQAVVSRTVGAGREDRIASVLAGAYAGAIPLAVVVAAITWAVGPGLIKLILPDPAAAAAGGAWVSTAAPSIVLLSITLPINAAWIASGRPAIAASVTALSAPLQIGLTWCFVLGAGSFRGLGASGAALAMDVTMLAGVVVQVALALRLIPGFLHVWSWRIGLSDIAAIGWPISLQQSLLQVALMAVFAVIAQLGAAPAAIISVLLNLTAIPTQVATGLGGAAATLAGQSLGRGNVSEARAWGWRTTAITVLLTLPMGLALTLAPAALLGPFLRDPATLALAILPARIVGAGVAINAAAVVLGYVFRGAGATKIAALAPFLSLWCLELPLMAWIGLGLRQGLTGIVWVQMGVVSCDAMVLGLLWAGASWSRVWISTAASGLALPTDLRRIAILGGAGAGKSTLARRLGEALGLPVVHLDLLVFGPGWRARDIDVARGELTGAIEPGRWIVEGSYPWASELTLPAADLVLWLDQPVWLRLFRSWRKTVRHRNRPRADRPEGCAEGFGWNYARMVLAFGAWTPEVANTLESVGAGRARRLRGDRDVRRLLAEVGADARSE